MSFSPSSAPSDAASSVQAGEAAFYRGALHELAVMGMSLARLVHEKAHAEAARLDEGGESGAGTLPALVAAFDRVSRSVRRTAGLARQFDDDGMAERDDGRRVAARRRIIRVLEDKIKRQAPNVASEERLHEELLERLDGPDLDDDAGVRPVDEIIEELCRDLGLSDMPGIVAFKRRTPADVAALCARAEKRRDALDLRGRRGEGVVVRLTPDG